MSTPFAALERALGTVPAIFANAVATLAPGGEGVPGVFTREADVAGGGIGMLARNVTFFAPMAALQGIDTGSELSITPFSEPAATWRVRARTDVLETGDALLTLEQAA